MMIQGGENFADPGAANTITIRELVQSSNQIVPFF